MIVEVVAVVAVVGVKGLAEEFRGTQGKKEREKEAGKDLDVGERERERSFSSQWNHPSYDRDTQAKKLMVILHTYQN